MERLPFNQPRFNKIMKATTVLFDAFGTLIKIQGGAHPYRQIIRIGMEQGRRPSPADAATLLSMPLGLIEAAYHFGITVPHLVMADLEASLQKELDSLEAYEDGLKAVSMLQAAGVPVGICSNLAKPYASAVERLYPSVRMHAYSFEAGAIKPSPEMFDYASEVMGAESPSNVALIGDSLRCDRDGARAYGMEGYLLCRVGRGDYHSLVEFAHDIISVRASRLSPSPVGLGKRNGDSCR